jgi:hypothetical protein
MEKIRTIGIDPGKQTGVAVYDREKKEIIITGTMNFWSCYDWIIDVYNKDTVIIVIECPVKSAMYARQEGNVKSARYGNRMMANASANAHEADLLAIGLELKGYEVRRVRPKRRNFETAEQDREYVKQQTGYDGESNPHTRDAIMLCYGI